MYDTKCEYVLGMLKNVLPHELIFKWLNEFIFIISFYTVLWLNYYDILF